MTDENTVKDSMTDEEILARAKQINEQREQDRIKEEKRLEEDQRAREAEAALQKKIEEDKHLEEIAKAQALLEEEKKKQEEEARRKEAEKQAAILHAEEEKRAAEAKKAAELAAAKKLVEEDRKKNPEKKKHTGLKVTLIILCILIAALVVTAFSFGVQVNNLGSSGAVTDNTASYQIWLPVDKVVSIGDYSIVANQKTGTVLSLTYGNQNELLYQNVPNQNIKDCHIVISLLWGALPLQEFDLSSHNMTYHSTNAQNDAYCTAAISTTQPVTGQSLLIWALGLKGVTVV